MSRFTGTAPGVDFQEQVEEALKSQGISNAIGIVGVAQKGPTEVTLLTSPKECLSIFGDAPSNNSAIMGALACLKNSREVYFKRVLSKNAAQGVTWAAVIKEATQDLSEGLTQAAQGIFEATIASVTVVPGTVKIVSTSAVTSNISDDAEGNLVDKDGIKVGSIDYETGKVTFTFTTEPQLSECTYNWSDNSQNPWVVFNTKDFTGLYNGWKVNLEWDNVGTEDVPKYKVYYSLYDENNHLKESYVCDEDASEDLYLGKVINYYSEYLEVVVNGEAATREKTVFTIANGNSGLDATVEDIIGNNNSGMKAFYDPEAIDISTLVVPTWADKRVWEEGIRIGEYRKDIVFIPSLPIGLIPKRVVDLVRGVGEYTTLGLQYDRTFVPVYWPNGLLKNAATGKLEVVDIAPYVASTYAYSDSISNVWTAPAGVKRGVIHGLDGLEYKTTKEERDMLYSDEVNVNSVMNVKGHGIRVMGVRTSKLYKITDGNTSLRYVNVRRLCNYVRKVVLQESMYNLFDQNDNYTWNDWKLRLDPYFRTIKEGRGLYDYEIIMDESTVSQADIDAGRMPGKIRIAPIKPNEYIVISFIVAKDGTVSFSEDVEV